MPKVYIAPKPRYSNWGWFKFIILRALFPPILLWDLLRIGINKLVGARVGSIVLPAQNNDFSDCAVDDTAVNQYDEADAVCEKHEVITHDGAHLDTFEIQHTSQKNIDPKYQKYIVNFVGNGMCYEHIIEEMLEDALALQSNIVGFNFRGVGQSSGRATEKNDLVLDGIAQVQRLIDQGISPHNIILHGHSLGAAIASIVAQHFHQLDQPVNVFNGRSFSSITNYLVGLIRLDTDKDGIAWGHKEKTKGIFWGELAKPFIKAVAVLAKWEINAGDAYIKIPEAYKDYIVVRSRKDIRAERIDDAVIPHYASLHKALTSKRKAPKAAIDQLIIKMEDGTAPEEEHQVTKESLIKTREKIKSDRKMETDYIHANGHVVPLDSLHNRSGTSAQTFFREFVQRVADDHAVKYEDTKHIRGNRR